MPCPYCQATDHEKPEACPRVSAIDYEFGRVKRIEFFAPQTDVRIMGKPFDPGGLIE